jgi:hypothetical protein
MPISWMETELQSNPYRKNQTIKSQLNVRRGVFSNERLKSSFEWLLKILPVV